MMALTRVVRASLQELDRRLALKTSMVADDDAAVDLVRDSVVCRSVAGMVRVWSTAAEHSSGMSWVRAVIAEWTASAWFDRARAAGAALLAAVIVYVGLNLLSGAPQGWLWLIIPALAVSAGALLLAASWQPRPKGRSL